jgi:H+/Cl- antiporter ClcA
MDLIAFTVFAVSIWIVWLTNQTARRRGRSVRAWMWLAILFGPFAWLAVVLLPSIRENGDGFNGSNGGNPDLPTGSAPVATAGKIAMEKSSGLQLRQAPV